MVATVSHELRSPLNTLVVSGSLMEDTIEQITKSPAAANFSSEIMAEISELEETLSLVTRSGKHMQGVVSSILDEAVISSGTNELTDQIVPLVELTDFPCSIVKPLAEQAGIDLSYTPDPTLPLVNVDVGRIRQIMINLLSNAVKFTPSGGQIVLSAEVQKDGSVHISVADNGNGIADSAIAGLFNKFTQHSREGVRGEAGTGLGLALSLGMAEMHGGTIDVQSTLGKGATFSLVLPATRVFSSTSEITTSYDEIEPLFRE